MVPSANVAEVLSLTTPVVVKVPPGKVSRPFRGDPAWNGHPATTRSHTAGWRRRRTNRPRPTGRRMSAKLLARTQRRLAGGIHLVDGVAVAKTRPHESTRRQAAFGSARSLPPSNITAHQLVAQRALRVRGLACASERASPNAAAVGLALQPPRGRQCVTKVGCGAVPQSTEPGGRMSWICQSPRPRCVKSRENVNAWESCRCKALRRATDDDCSAVNGR